MTAAYSWPDSVSQSVFQLCIHLALALALLVGHFPSIHSCSVIPGTPRLGMRPVTGAGVASSPITTLLSQSCKRTHQLATPQLPLRTGPKGLQVSRPPPTSPKTPLPPPSTPVPPLPPPPLKPSFPPLSTFDTCSPVTCRCASSTLVLCHAVSQVSTAYSSNHMHWDTHTLHSLASSCT